MQRTQNDYLKNEVTNITHITSIFSFSCSETNILHIKEAERRNCIFSYRCGANLKYDAVTGSKGACTHWYPIPLKVQGLLQYLLQLQFIAMYDLNTFSVPRQTHAKPYTHVVPSQIPKFSKLLTLTKLLNIYNMLLIPKTCTGA